MNGKGQGRRALSLFLFQLPCGMIDAQAIVTEAATKILRVFCFEYMIEHTREDNMTKQTIKEIIGFIFIVACIVLASSIAPTC